MNKFSVLHRPASAPSRYALGAIPPPTNRLTILRASISPSSLNSGDLQLQYPKPKSKPFFSTLTTDQFLRQSPSMAEEVQYGGDSAATPPPLSPDGRRTTGFSAPISQPLDSKTLSSVTVPPPVDEIEIAMQKAREILALGVDEIQIAKEKAKEIHAALVIFNSSKDKGCEIENGSDNDYCNSKGCISKRPKFENGGSKEFISGPIGGDKDGSRFLPHIVVNVRRCRCGATAMGVIQEVLPDGSCRVVLGESEKSETVVAHSDEIEIVVPRKSDKFRIITGALRGATGKLIGVDYSDGIVKLDFNLEVKIFEMEMLAKLA